MEPEYWLPSSCVNQAHSHCNIHQCGHLCCRDINPKWTEWEENTQHDAVRKRVLGENAGLADTVEVLPSNSQIEEFRVWIHDLVGDDAHGDY